MSDASHICPVLRALLFARQVVSTALPESKNLEQVSVAIESFMQAGLHAELIEPLEKIVQQDSCFSNNHNLQNLLIITAIRVVCCSPCMALEDPSSLAVSSSGAGRSGLCE